MSINEPNVKSNFITAFHYEIKDRLLWGIKLALAYNKLISKDIIKLFKWNSAIS